MTDLDDRLAEARSLCPVPSDALSARVLADACAVADGWAPVAPGWRDWLAALGGWPAMGGLAASVAAGVWLGAAAPAGLPDLASRVWGEGVSLAFGLDEDPLSALEG